MKPTVWQELAKAPRKSYLGKYKKLTPMQERWIKAILCVWAEEFGGGGYGGGALYFVGTQLWWRQPGRRGAYSGD